ncbi:hypothetical protein BG000_003399 [Podila horticola]|nr:hypothetical protein BG000_003399 [Podila horticola]
MSFFKKSAFWKAVFKRPHYSYDSIPDLSSKVALVTGANTGLGYATMVALASQGAHVVAACRSEQRAMKAIEKAKQEIKTKNPSAAPKIEFLQLDLNDINSSAQAAKNFLSMGLPLHILVNNGGIATTPFALSADGIEQQLAINHPLRVHSGPAAADQGVAAFKNRRRQGGIDFKTLNDETAMSPGERYGRSKLANLLFAKALARRLQDERVYVNVAHPGLVATELNRSNEASFGKFGSRLIEGMNKVFAVKPEVGALTQLYCATSPEIESKDMRGKYFIPIAHELDPNPIAFDEDLQERLWRWTENIVRENLKV